MEAKNKPLLKNLMGIWGCATGTPVVGSAFFTIFIV
jgi:hypothetical protein